MFRFSSFECGKTPSNRLSVYAKLLRQVRLMLAPGDAATDLLDICVLGAALAARVLAFRLTAR